MTPAQRMERLQAGDLRGVTDTGKFTCKPPVREDTTEGDSNVIVLISDCRSPHPLSHGFEKYKLAPDMPPPGLSLFQKLESHNAAKPSDRSENFAGFEANSLSFTGVVQIYGVRYLFTIRDVDIDGKIDSLVIYRPVEGTMTSRNVDHYFFDEDRGEFNNVQLRIGLKEDERMLPLYKVPQIMGPAQLAYEEALRAAGLME